MDNNRSDQASWNWQEMIWWQAWSTSKVYGRSYFLCEEAMGGCASPTDPTG
jgi:hypothetical protein